MKILHELSWLWETLGIALVAAAVCVACAALIGKAAKKKLSKKLLAVIGAGTITECEQDIRKIGIQFAICQQIGISPTVMLLEIAEVPLSPYPDWLILLRLVLPGDKVVVPDKLIVQACPFVCDDFFHCSVLLMIFCNHCSRRVVRNRMCK